MSTKNFSKRSITSRNGSIFEIGDRVRFDGSAGGIYSNVTYVGQILSISGSEKSPIVEIAMSADFPQNSMIVGAERILD